MKYAILKIVAVYYEENVWDWKGTSSNIFIRSTGKVIDLGDPNGSEFKIKFENFQLEFKIEN